MSEIESQVFKPHEDNKTTKAASAVIETAANLRRGASEMAQILTPPEIQPLVTLPIGDALQPETVAQENRQTQTRIAEIQNELKAMKNPTPENPTQSLTKQDKEP